MKEEKRSFEDNISELEDIVLALENGNLPLEEAINNYTKAMNLAKLCNDELKDATTQVNQILTSGSLEEFKIDEGSEKSE